MKAVKVLAAVVVAHYVYYLWPAGRDRQWMFYIGSGIGFSLLAWAVLDSIKTRAVAGVLAASGCWWAIFEGAQTAVCGAVAWRSGVNEGDLCVTLFGPWPYVIAAALSVSALFGRNHG